MKLPRIERAQVAVARIFGQRCFYLFLALLAMIATAPLLEFTVANRIAFNVLQLAVLVAAVAAVGRGPLPFLAATLLALPALAFQVMGIRESDLQDLLRCWAFTAGFHTLVLGYLLGYVFRDDVMTSDKLFGAASAYLLLAVLWTYLYQIAQAFAPGAFAMGGTPTFLTGPDAIYFSVTVLTSTGFGEIVPLAPVARSLVMMEQVTGVLFIAILIARLAGVYPPRR